MDQSIKLLVVDDEELIRLNLRAMLEDLGYSVTEASNGQEGLDAFDRQRPDLVLADLRMPMMDGRAMIAKLYDKSPETPVIVISGTGTVRDAIDSLRLGAWDYIAKPISAPDSDGLDMIIKRAIDKARLIRENRAYREKLEELVSERTIELLESENRYKRLLESVISYVYSVELKNGIPETTAHSPGCRTVTGFSPEEYAVDPGLWFRSVHEDDRPLILQMSRQILEHSSAVSFEHRINHKDGSVRWVNNTLVPHPKGKRKTLSYDGIIVDITDRKVAGKALRDSEAKIRSILDNIGIGVALISPEMEVLELNRRMREWFPDMDLEQQSPKCFRMFNRPPRDNVCNNCPTLMTLHDCSVHEAVIQRSHDTSIRHYRIVSSPIINPEGKIAAVIELVEDITEQLSLESQVRQSQKMESIGRLAGGVAHDFNNMLGVILGYTELVMENVDQSLPIFSKLQEIRKAAMRSADLTRQLLAFARKQTVSPRILDLNQTVEGMLKMLRRLIGEDITLSWVPGEGLSPIKIDPTQIDQILANLCVNARDAISGVGRIIIETRPVIIDKAYCVRHQEMVPGEYMLLALSDNGCGMNREVLSRIFEPFFTTKESGKGTGLGLSTVYGIVKQNNGSINVYSEPGIGTTFKIYLPKHEVSAEDIEPDNINVPVATGNENILLVEDEPSILEMSRIMLERLGYHVLTATMPSEAIRLAKKHRDDIHLIVTDVVMPEMNGRNLVNNIMSVCPGIKHIYISGYTSSVIAHHGILEDGVNFIQKPFSIQTLAAKVRETLDNK